MDYQPTKVRRAAAKVETEMTPARREQLALKGQRLYYKFCGLNGEGICAESFAEYHLLREEDVIVYDLLEFLRAEVERLRTQPEPTRLVLTELLIQRIEALGGQAFSHQELASTDGERH